MRGRWTMAKDAPELACRVALLEARISHAWRIAGCYEDPRDAIMQMAAALAGCHKRSREISQSVMTGEWDGACYDDRARSIPT